MNDKRAINLNKSPFGKGNVHSNTSNVNSNPKPYPTKAQDNGTNTLNYNTKVNNKTSAIRGHDIGNNAKYDRANQMAKNTTALPSNFWESGSEDDTDSDEERIMKQHHIADNWGDKQSHIRDEKEMAKWTHEMKEIEDQQTLAPIHRGVKLTQTKPSTYVYGNESSSEDGDNDAEYGFEKYVLPVPSSAKPTLTIKKPTLDDKYINNKTTWIVHEQNKQMIYDMKWFKLQKMRNGKANGLQMKDTMEGTGLSRPILKKIWKLADVDKDGNMGNEEFALCLFLLEKAQKGESLPDMLPPNYVPPSFRGQALPKTPPKKPKKPKSMPPNVNMGLNASNTATMPNRAPPTGGYNIAPKPQRIAPKIQPKQASSFGIAPNASNPPQQIQRPIKPVRPQVPQQRPVVYKQTQHKVVTQRRVQKPYAKPQQNASQFGAGPDKPQQRAQPQQQRAVYTQQRTQTRQQPVVYQQAPQQGTVTHSGFQQQRRANDYTEMEMKAQKAADAAGKQAKKALGWMAKKMNQLNEKVQDGNQNNSGYNSNQRQYNNNGYQKKY